MPEIDIMRKIVVFFWVLAVFGTNFTLFAEDDDKQKLAVMEFEDQSGKLSKKMLSSATEYIRGAFVSTNKYVVIAKERQVFLFNFLVFMLFFYLFHAFFRCRQIFRHCAAEF